MVGSVSSRFGFGRGTNMMISALITSPRKLSRQAIRQARGQASCDRALPSSRWQTMNSSSLPVSRDRASWQLDRRMLPISERQLRRPCRLRDPSLRGNRQLRSSPPPTKPDMKPHPSPAPFERVQFREAHGLSSNAKPAADFSGAGCQRGHASLDEFGDPLRNCAGAI